MNKLIVNPAASSQMYEALGKADTAFAVLNICDWDTPQARHCLRDAWAAVNAAMAAATGRPDRYAEANAPDSVKTKYAVQLLICTPWGREEVNDAGEWHVETVEVESAVGDSDVLHHLATAQCMNAAVAMGEKIVHVGLYSIEQPEEA